MQITVCFEFETLKYSVYTYDNVYEYFDVSRIQREKNYFIVKTGFIRQARRLLPAKRFTTLKCIQYDYLKRIL